MFAMFVGSPLFIILCVAIGPAIWFMIALGGRANVKKAQNLMTTGARARGAITSVSDTGMTINDNPRVAITAQLQPEDGSPAFAVQQTVTVSRIAIPRAGDQIVAWYDRSDPSQWTWQPASVVATTT